MVQKDRKVLVCWSYSYPWRIHGTNSLFTDIDAKKINHLCTLVLQDPCHLWRGNLHPPTLVPSISWRGFRTLRRYRIFYGTNVVMRNHLPCTKKMKGKGWLFSYYTRCSLSWKNMVVKVIYHKFGDEYLFFKETTTLIYNYILSYIHTTPP